MAATPRERLAAARRARVQAYQEQMRRYEAWAAAEEQLRALLPKALAVLERSLDDPLAGPRVALALLRAAGLWGLEPVRKPDPFLSGLSAVLEDLPGDEG